MPGRTFYTYTLGDLIAATDFDGFFGDTMGGITEDYLNDSLARHHKYIAMEPEAFHAAPDFNWITMGWG